MVMNTRGLLIAFAACLGLFVGNAKAGYVSNLGESILGSSQVHGSHWLAQSFTLDGYNYNLTSVTLGLSPATSGGGNFIVQIRDDAAGSPGSTVLATLSGNADPSAGGNVTYTGNLLLSANQTYYVVAGETSGTGNYSWYGTFSDNQTGTLAWDIGNDLFASTGTPGTDWGTGPVNTVASLMEIEASVAVPEPSTMTFAAISLIGAVTVRRLRRGRTAA